jgi:hypothetical protein
MLLFISKVFWFLLTRLFHCRDSTLCLTSNNAIASRLMADLKNEQRWTEQFESTSDEQWDRLADMARQEIASGDTVSSDEVFPVKP